MFSVGSLSVVRFAGSLPVLRGSSMQVPSSLVEIYCLLTAYHIYVTKREKLNPKFPKKYRIYPIDVFPSYCYNTRNIIPCFVGLRRASCKHPLSQENYLCKIVLANESATISSLASSDEAALVMSTSASRSMTTPQLLSRYCKPD